ncbi:hypothetical protein ACIGEL_19430 [Rossellomorea aquimaris]|uniref:hypothetical protein n=1 Tax=Rossellomorea aquimaris TaxID=189382 RepID=UPI0037CA9E51
MVGYITKSRSKAIFFIATGIWFYRILLDYLYVQTVVPLFGYSGFHANNQINKYFLSWVILFIFTPIIIKMFKKSTLSSLIIILLSFLSFIPFTCMIAFHSYTTEFIISNIVYWLALFIFYNTIPTIKLVRVTNDKFIKLILSLIVLIFFAVILFISWRYTGFRLSINLMNVYDIRSEATMYQLPSFLSYIYSASKAINPVLIVYFMSRKKYSIASFIFFIQLLSFSINGSKTVFFTTVLAVLLYWIYNDNLKNKLPWFFFLISLLGLLEFYIVKSYLIIGFIIRRVFFVPNLLNYYYYDFFSIHTPDYLKQSFLRHIGFESPYIPIDNLIATIYFGKPDMGANNGLFSDAYANFGIFGLLIMPLLVVLSFKFFDACSEGLDTKIFIVSGITLAFIFISSFFFTVLFTHGFLALCLILYLLPRDKLYR